MRVDCACDSGGLVLATAADAELYRHSIRLRLNPRGPQCNRTDGSPSNIVELPRSPSDAGAAVLEDPDSWYSWMDHHRIR